ncbi:MAG: hypothetical protein IJ870_00995 [Alphaproteobacteria bacterium]|nr:hypothetical protein [Alphaproteobacteria bacterium]
MNKKLLLSLLLVFCVGSFSVQAQPKEDVPSAFERALTAVQTKVDEVTTKINTAAKKVEESQFGQSIKTKYEAMMAWKQKVEQKVAAGKEIYEQNMNAAKELYGEGKKLYDDGKNMYEQGAQFAEQTKDMAEGVYEDTIGELKRSDLASTVTLTNQLNDIRSQMKERKEVVSTELAARVKSADENIDVLQQMYAEAQDEGSKELLEVLMSEANMLKSQYESGLESLSADDGEYLKLDEEYQNLQAQYDQTNELLKQAEENVKQKGLSLAATFVQNMIKKSKEQKAAEYGEMEDENFVGKDMPLTASTVDKVMQARRQNLKDDVINGIVQVMNMRAKETEEDEKTEMVADNIAEVDYAITAQRLSSGQRIQGLKLMEDNLALEISAMKLDTSLNMLNQDLRTKHSDRVLSEIRLENYQMTEETLKENGLKK